MGWVLKKVQLLIKQTGLSSASQAQRIKWKGEKWALGNYMSGYGGR